MDPFSDLIRNAKCGDLAALRELVVSHESLIKSECSQFGLWQFPEWSHSDLSQEVAIRVLTQLNQFRGDSRALFRSWLRTVTRNTVKNILRRRANTFNSPGGPLESLVDELCKANGRQVSTASSIVSKEEQARRVRKVLVESLDDVCREILRLRILEGETYGTIAELMGLSQDQIRYRFEISLGRLKFLFDDNDESLPERE